MRNTITRLRDKWHHDLNRLSHASEANLNKAIAASRQSLETAIEQMKPPIG